jgi:hypothetical protein
MLYLCINPTKVYRNLYYQKQTKNRWARDDPAFVMIQSACVLISAIAYGLAYGVGFIGLIRLIIYMVVFEFLGVGLVISTSLWYIFRISHRFLCNRFMLNQSIHGTPQEVEWAYAFDIHCNAFFPAFLFTYVAQFFFLFLISGGRWIGLFIGNTLYLCAACFYMYNTFLGYNGKRGDFIDRSTAVFKEDDGVLVSNWIRLYLLLFESVWI